MSYSSDALPSLLSNFVLEYSIRNLQANQEGLKLNGTHQLLVYADDFNVLGANTDTTLKRNKEAVVVTSKDTGVEVNNEKTKYMVTSRDKHAGQNHNIQTGNKSFERV
jgi:hypothetical protein